MIDKLLKHLHFDDLSIRRKLFIHLFVYVLLIASVVSITIFLNNKIRTEFDHFSKQTLPVIEIIEDLRFTGLEIVSTTAEYSFFKSEQSRATGDTAYELEEELEHEEEKLKAEEQKFFKILNLYEQHVKTSDPAESVFLKDIRITGQLLQITSRKIVESKKQGVPDSELADFIELIEDFEEHENKFLDAIDRALAYENIEYSDRRSSTLYNIEFAINAITLIGIVAVGLLFIISIFIFNSISRPIVELNDSVNEFGKGKLEKRIEVKTKDEIGTLASSFNKMADELQVYNVSLENEIVKRIKELEEAQNELIQKERLAAIGQLISTVSHELRNPLGTIKASAYLISEKLQGTQSSYDKVFTRIETNINRCEKIISQLLDYTRVRNLELRSVNIDQWLANFLNEYEIQPSTRLEKELSSNISLMVDEDKLRRVMVNLCDNACQAMEVKSEIAPFDMVLKVQAKVAENRLEIRVKDNGIGIHKEDLKRVFDLLYSKKSFGVGLGLTVVKQIMEEHKGQVEISSEEGKGTEVLIWFPLG